MKIYWLYISFLLVLFLIQSSLLNVFANAIYLLPQLLLLFILIFALTHSLPETLWFAFGAGFLQELYAGQFFGSQFFALILAGFGTYFITRNLTARETSGPTAVSIVGFGTLIYVLGIYLFNGLGTILHLANSESLGQLFTLKILWTFLLNLLFFYPLRLIFKLFYRHERPV